MDDFGKFALLIVVGIAALSAIFITYMCVKGC